ncbi:S8 family serine peptidase [Micromonospora sp. CPCC 205371]|nr:S8 family serine peptidase [Micromonospora sp. CPCC 205371]
MRRNTTAAVAIATMVAAMLAAPAAPAGAALAPRGAAGGPPPPPRGGPAPDRPSPEPRMDPAVRAAAGVAPAPKAGKGRQRPGGPGGGGGVGYAEGPEARALRKGVGAAGGTVSDTHANRVRASVPAKALRKLAASEAVTELRRPEAPVPLEVVSEGAQPSGALAWHSSDRQGAGVKVGILDVGFGGLAEAQEAGEVPAATTVNNGLCGPTEDQQTHGTVMAEIVHDMAPQAQLYLACVTDSMDFDDAARWLDDQGVHVVNVSMAFPGTGRGSGKVESNQANWSPATVVGWLRGNGVVVVAAAGNEGDKHMTGTTVDPDGNGWMNVSGSAEVQSFNAQPGARVTMELRWDAWPLTNNDLELFVTRSVAKPTGPNDPNLVTSSIRPQKETTGGLSPVETATFDNTTGGAATYYVHVQRKDGAATDLRYDLTAYGNVVGLAYSNAAGSVAEPATSPYAIAVGAITVANATTGGAVEQNSSRGPTIDGRVKPDVVGYTNVTAYTGGSVLRRGTSVAAAHVSGAAALYKSANTTLDPAELEALLLDSSTRPGRDNDLGHGVVNVGAPRDPAPPTGGAFTPQAARRVLDTTTNVGGHPAPLQAGETVTVPISGLPSDATAVALNLTASSATAPTRLEVSADTGTGASALSAIPNATTSAMAIATLEPSQKVVRIRNVSGGVHVAADVLGYFSTTSSAATYTPARRPIRLAQPAATLDGGQANARAVPVRGVAGIPNGAVAAAVSVTITNASERTSLRLYASNWPANPTFGVRPGEAVTYDHILPIGDDGQIRIGNDSGSVRVTVDVVGWFAPGSGARYVPLRYSERVFSTASGTSTDRKAFGRGEQRLVRVTAGPRIPFDATGAALTLATPRAQARSQVALWADEYGWSGAPSISAEAVQSCAAAPGWAPGANSTITPLGPSGNIRVRNYDSTVDATVGIAGYFVGGQPADPPAAPAPVSRWTFDEGSGNTVADSVGGRHAAWQGGNGWSGGAAGTAGRFATTRHVATTAPAVRTDQSFTVSAWVHISSRGGAVLGQEGSVGSGFYLEYIGDRWSFSALSQDGTSPPAARALGLPTPPVNSWTHLTGVYDAPAHQLRLYVDGVLAGVANNVTLWNATGPFTIGAAKFNGQRVGMMTASIDDVRAYQSALTDNDVRQLFGSYGVPPTMQLPPYGAAPGWYGWNSPDGTTISAPAVTSSGPNKIDLIAKGSDNVLYHQVYDGAWRGWEPIGDGLASAPAVVSWGPGRIDLFARGHDNALWHRAYDGTWHGWQSLGGVIKHAPTVSSWAPGRLDVFVVGGDDALHHRTFEGQWYGWERLGGVLNATPAAVSWGPNRIDIFARGADNHLHHMAWENGWVPFHDLGGDLATGPAVTSWGPNRLDVFLAGADGAVHHTGWNGTWMPWTNFGARPASEPTAIARGVNRLDVFVRGPGNTLCHAYYG